MELEGRKELVETGKSSGTWSVPTVSLRLAVLNGFQGFFGPKMAVFGPKLQFLKLRSATWESRSRPPPLSFSLKLCVIVLHTHRYHAPKFHSNLKHHDGNLIFVHFAHPAACLLAAAKPGRSTLDTKKGYKIKTGSTSSVTLTLIPPPHPWLDAPLTPGQTPPIPGRKPPSPDPRLDPPPTPPPPKVLKDSWGVGRIRTSCSRPRWCSGGGGRQRQHQSARQATFRLPHYPFHGVSTD